MDFLLSFISEPLDFAAGSVVTAVLFGSGFLIKNVRKRNSNRMASFGETSRVAKVYKDIYVELDKKVGDVFNIYNTVKIDFAMEFPKINFDKNVFKGMRPAEITESMERILLLVNRLENSHVTVSEVTSIEEELKKKVERIENLNRSLKYFSEEIREAMDTYFTMKPLFDPENNELEIRVADIKTDHEEALEKYSNAFLQEMRPLIYTAEEAVRTFNESKSNFTYASRYELRDMKRDHNEAVQKVDEAREAMDKLMNYSKHVQKVCLDIREILRKAKPFGSTEEVAHVKAMASVIEAESLVFTDGDPSVKVSMALGPFVKYCKLKSIDNTRSFQNIMNSL